MAFNVGTNQPLIEQLINRYFMCNLLTDSREQTSVDERNVKEETAPQTTIAHVLCSISK